MAFYAYYLIDERKTGIVDSWDKCKIIISKKNSRYKKFNTLELANEWIKNGCTYEKKEIDYSSLIKDAIYFDAGTGRGIGVEVRVTDLNKNSLLHYVLPDNLINKFGNYQVGPTRTNNFGELTGLFFALKYALKYDIKYILGDSKLVIDYWVHCIYNKNNIDGDTINLIQRTNKLYNKFVSRNGVLKRISGDINPADLGFHK